MATYFKLVFIIFLSHLLIHINICSGARLLKYITHSESSTKNDNITPTSKPTLKPDENSLFPASTDEPEEDSLFPASAPEPASELIPEPEESSLYSTSNAFPINREFLHKPLNPRFHGIPYNSPFYKVTTPRTILPPNSIQPKIPFGGIEVALGLP